MPKIVDHEERKRCIVERALELFAHRGFSETGFADIAEACGLSRTHLYHYFRSKDEIFLYAVEGALGRIASGIEEIAQRNDLLLRDKLAHAFSLFAESRTNGTHAPILLELAMKLRKENTLIAARLHEQIRVLNQSVVSLLRGVGSEIQESRVPLVASVFFALVESTLLSSLFADAALIQEHIGEMVQMLGC